ncbi:leucine-rich single-pass membrane protein 1 [Ambystoma mexicanum]|uniref:leucine-rich single-pass membrane protein 1 n=1 Tax=Ambystoma mexicanum TaxID=8296 RepID=UPI0037E8307C
MAAGFADMTTGASRPGTMTASSDLLTQDQEGKLYAVDSLNNLNKLNLCIEEGQDLMQEKSTPSLPWSTMKRQCICLLMLIMAVAVPFILVSHVAIFFAQANKDTDDMLNRLTSGAKEIDALRKINNLIFNRLNKTEV